MHDQNINIESSPRWTILHSTYSKSTYSDKYISISFPSRVHIAFLIVFDVIRFKVDPLFFFFFYEGMIRLEKVEVATTSNRGIGGKSNSKASTAERAESVFGQPSSRTLLRRVNVPRFSNRCEYTTPAGIEWDPDKEVIEIVLKRSVHVNRHLFFEILRCLPSYQDAVLCESSC